jgi:hypothetical protein
MLQQKSEQRNRKAPPWSQSDVRSRENNSVSEYQNGQREEAKDEDIYFTRLFYFVMIGFIIYLFICSLFSCALRNSD